MVLRRVSRRQRRHEPTDLGPDALVQVEVRGGVGARHDQREAEQRRPVFLGRQEVDLLRHLKRETSPTTMHERDPLDHAVTKNSVTGISH